MRWCHCFEKEVVRRVKRLPDLYMLLVHAHNAPWLDVPSFFNSFASLCRGCQTFQSALAQLKLQAPRTHNARRRWVLEGFQLWFCIKKKSHFARTKSFIWTLSKLNRASLFWRGTHCGLCEWVGSCRLGKLHIQRYKAAVSVVEIMQVFSSSGSVLGPAASSAGS